jgi:hypothetical protein
VTRNKPNPSEGCPKGFPRGVSGDAIEHDPQRFDAVACNGTSGVPNSALRSSVQQRQPCQLHDLLSSACRRSASPATDPPLRTVADPLLADLAAIGG